MWQRWSDLLFLHWTLPAEVIQATLPPGLSVDTFQDQAWVGVVPFFMSGVRPVGLPPAPWLSAFLELNVRTYVRDNSGRPGVWFYSLDCNRWPAVEIARKGFHLAYQHAELQAQRTTEGWVDYQAQRKALEKHRVGRWRYRGTGEIFRAEAGTLECFLAERYRLFSWNPVRQQLYTGEVWHEPYPLQAAEVMEWSAVPAEWNGLFKLEGPPATQHFSAGVDVGIFLPARGAGLSLRQIRSGVPVRLASIDFHEILPHPRMDFPSGAGGCFFQSRL